MIPPPRLLAAARVLAGLSQADLAKRANVGIGALSRYEAGKTTPRIDTIAALVDALAELGVGFLEGGRDIEMGVVIRRRRQARSR
jgi:transcriptional regulator with XRE-family HTH domain